MSLLVWDWPSHLPSNGKGNVASVLSQLGADEILFKVSAVVQNTPIMTTNTTLALCLSYCYFSRFVLVSYVLVKSSKEPVPTEPQLKPVHQ